MWFSEKCFHFGKKENDTFDILKKALASQPVLNIYSPKLETELYYDASATGFGSILMQKQENNYFKPVFYFSRRTTPIEAKYHSFKLECLSVVYAIKRFPIYLSGIHFEVITCYDSFRLTLSKQNIDPRILRWAMFFQNHDFAIERRQKNGSCWCLE